MNDANFGILGLGVMGRMLALNMERNGFRVAVYDVDAEKVSAFGSSYPGKNLVACKTLDEFLAVLERPCRIMMMVPAGKVVDMAIESISAALELGDLLIDGGNSFFLDTERRSQALEAKKIIYIGTGVSGGEYGALWSPAIMPGGQQEAWGLVKPIFEAISARLPANLTQAQRDYFGAHTYRRADREGVFHTEWQ